MGKVSILSRSGELFRDRTQAGMLLGKALTVLGFVKPVVLGIPRGGVVIAKEVASVLGGEIDVALSRKIGAPEYPELALGAIAEDGKVFMNEWAKMRSDDPYVLQEKEAQMALIRRRREEYRKIAPRIPLKGRVVIVVDDGLATGSTMKAALWTVRNESPSRLVAAFPVGSEESVNALSDYADEVFCLRAPPGFYAVGQFYIRFDQVEDDEVLRILGEH